MQQNWLKMLFATSDASSGTVQWSIITMEHGRSNVVQIARLLFRKTASVGSSMAVRKPVFITRGSSTTASSILSEVPLA